jgi:hypothetical protein
MRRLLSIAAFALILAVPLWAQRGGGGHAGGFGGHAGSFGGHAGFAGGGHFSGGSHAGGSPSHGFTSRPGSSHQGFSSRGFSHFNGRGPIITNSFGGRRGFGRFGSGRFRNSWGWGYPWWGYGWDPYWWNNDDAEYDQQTQAEYDRAQQMNDENLAEMQMRRQEEADGDQDAYAPPSIRRAPRPAASDDPQPTPMMPPTILVFRDQHKQEVQNYAIVGQTLWSFAPQRTQKIPLSQLDLEATTKANDDQGVTFRVPSASEAQ